MGKGREREPEKESVIKYLEITERQRDKEPDKQLHRSKKVRIGMTDRGAPTHGGTPARNMEPSRTPR